MEKMRTAVVQKFRQGSHVAHDEKHALRVAVLARYIAEKEGYDAYEAEAAGLLHDLGRTVQKEEKGHGPAGVPAAMELLGAYTSLDDAAKQRIAKAIHDHSELHTNGTLTHILQDADMLDGLGAIGLMRAYTSAAHLPDYDPANCIPVKGQKNTTIHDHIAYQMEWLGFMHTPTGKKIAQKRYDFMMEFLKTFEQEAQAKDLA